MATLPAKGDLDGSTVGHNQGMFKLAIGGVRDYLAGLFGTLGTSAGALDALKVLNPRSTYNLGISFAVGSNALTATIADSKGAALSATNPGHVAQRHATLSNGQMNLRTMTANISTVISSGSTAGHTSAVEGYLFWYLIDNAGTQELAWSSTYYGESGIYSTTAEGGAGAADSAILMYSTTARANVPGRLIAVTKDTQTTAGTWTSLPSSVQAAPHEVTQNTTGYQNQQFNPTKTLTDGANIAWNVDTNPIAQVTLAGNRQLDNPTKMKDGAWYSLRVYQDGSGGRTLSYGSAYKWEEAVAPIVSAGIGDVTILVFHSDGTNMHGAVFSRKSS